MEPYPTLILMVGGWRTFVRNSVKKEGSRYGAMESESGQILGSCEQKQRNELSIKFYLTNWIFQYISYCLSGKKWEKVVLIGKIGGWNDVQG